jgi:Domain of unknown function (DUF1996)/F5/8 type C domain
MKYQDHYQAAPRDDHPAGRVSFRLTAAVIGVAALAAASIAGVACLSSSAPGRSARLATGAAANRQPYVGDVTRTGAMTRRPARQRERSALSSMAHRGTTAMRGRGARGRWTLLSQGMPAMASSLQAGRVYPASAAVDGDPGTRWSSAPVRTTWLKVDLLALDRIRKVVLDWNPAYAQAFKIEVSRHGHAWTTIYSTRSGTGGTQILHVRGTGRWLRLEATVPATGYGYSLWEMQAYGIQGKIPPPPGMPMPMPVPPFHPNLDPGESINVSPPVHGVRPDQNFVYPSYVTHYEFQTDCAVTRDRQVDPIVYPRMAKSAHMHTFMGARNTSQDSTLDSLSGSRTSCVIPQDHSGYWFPAMYDGNKPVLPVGPQVIYYKSGIYDYRTVRPFPRGLRFVTGDDMATRLQFAQARGAVEGWECGNSAWNWTFPRSCPPGSNLVIRYQAPSCWDGKHLDVPDHHSNMAYPIHIDGQLACPRSHPVAVPMLEFKIAFPVHGSLARYRLASGPAYTWHYDFFNAWNPTVLAALVHHCINQGLQCDTHGFDQYLPQFGAVLDAHYHLIHH